MLVLVWEFLYVCINVTEAWLKISSFMGASILSLIFILVIFQLQTKYRAEMQDSEHYQKIWMKKMQQELDKTKTMDMKEMEELWQKKK